MTTLEVNGVSAGTGRGIAVWQRIDLPAPYMGEWVEMRVNPSARVVNSFTTNGSDVAQLVPILQTLIRAWSIDEFGPADDWLDLPLDWWVTIANTFSETVNRRVSVPKETSTPSAPGPSSSG